mmetsp:Transcript_25693/g.45020  ORF Transcript_25693/g.45020 Transcript_25693/m.45020 type:complete len:235 (-) Transcript_25693:569-1273(-)
MQRAVVSFFVIRARSMFISSVSSVSGNSAVKSIFGPSALKLSTMSIFLSIAWRAQTALKAKALMSSAFSVRACRWSFALFFLISSELTRMSCLDFAICRDFMFPSEMACLVFCRICMNRFFLFCSRDRQFTLSSIEFFKDSVSVLNSSNFMITPSANDVPKVSASLRLQSLTLLSCKMDTTFCIKMLDLLTLSSFSLALSSCAFLSESFRRNFFMMKVCSSCLAISEDSFCACF